MGLTLNVSAAETRLAMSSAIETSALLSFNFTADKERKEKKGVEHMKEQKKKRKREGGKEGGREKMRQASQSYGGRGEKRA